MQQKSISLTKRHWDALEKEAVRLGVSIGEVLRRVLDREIDDLIVAARKS